MLLNIIKYLPLKYLNYLLGFLADKEVHSLLLNKFLIFYCWLYKINQGEMSNKLSEYKTFNHFFTRDLKLGIRPIDKKKDIICSPADGELKQCGKIINKKLLQVKGKNYTLSELIGVNSNNKFTNGSYQTIYLSPADYHCVHSPCDAIIRNVIHYPGNYYPVNEWAVNNVNKLYCLNERILFVLEIDNKFVGLLLVGALVVGKINIVSPLIEKKIQKKQIKFTLPPDFKVKKGEKIASFSLGSTVIILYSPEFCNLNLIETKDKRIKLGVAISKII